ncbi:MAG: hypothetical protein COA31_002330 [Flavobacteriales bacterium]|nr:hypothetical protein [Flavobacteriales bacterium]
MKTKYYILIFWSSMMFFSCTQKELNVKDYLAWVNNPENGLKVSKEIKDYKIELFYKPAEYIAINEQKTTEIDTALFFQRIKEIKDFQYYTLKIESLKGTEMMRTNISSEHEYSQRLQYFSDLVQYDLSLEENNDTLSCQLFHFERNYGVAPYNNIVLGFPKPTQESAKTLVFNDQMLGIGKIKLKIEKENIDNIPNIILN